MNRFTSLHRPIPEMQEWIEDFWVDFIMTRDGTSNEDKVRNLLQDISPIDLSCAEGVESELDGVRCAQDDINNNPGKLKDDFQDRLNEIWDELNWLKDEYDLENGLPF